MGGASGNFGQSLVDKGISMGGQPPAQGGAQYSAPPTSNPYQSAFNSQQQTAPQEAPRLSPQVAQQQFAMQRMGQQPQMANPYQQMMPQQSSQQGLQMLLNNMMSRYGAPQQQAPMQTGMPQYQNQALQYRPDFKPAEQSLNRVAKSVVLQQKEAAEAELAAMKEAEAARASQEQASAGNWYGG